MNLHKKIEIEKYESVISSMDALQSSISSYWIEFVWYIPFPVVCWTKFDWYIMPLLFDTSALQNRIWERKQLFCVLKSIKSKQRYDWIAKIKFDNCTLLNGFAFVLVLKFVVEVVYSTAVVVVPLKCATNSKIIFINYFVLFYDYESLNTVCSLFLINSNVKQIL